jgi:DnaA N-terminal domain
MGEVVPLAIARNLDALIACKFALIARARVDARISDAEYRIYSAALDLVHRDEGDPRFGTLWPAVSKLGRDAAGKGRRTVQRALTKFTALGYLDAVTDRRGGRRKADRLVSARTSIYGLPGMSRANQGSFNSASGAPVSGNSAVAAPVNSANAAPVNSANGAPQSYREEPTEEKTALRAVSMRGRRQKARATLRRDVDLADWSPRDEDSANARERGYGQSWIDDQIERFRDHHLSKGSALQNVDAAWRNWQRGAFDRDECPPEPPSSVSRNSFEDLIREHLGEPGLRLLSRIGEPAWRHWLVDVGYSGVHDGTLRLTAPTKFVRDRLLQEFEQHFRASWRVERVEIELAKITRSP